MNEIQINVKNNIVNIYGDINFHNIVHTLNICINKTNDLQNIKVDLKNIENPNSCTLIFIINYIRSSMKKKQSIKFINIPVLLNDLSKVYNLNHIIAK